MKYLKFYIMAIIMAGTTVFFIFKYKQNENRMIRVEATALKQNKAATAQLAAAAQQHVKKTIQIAAEAQAYSAKVTNAVELVTGKPFKLRAAKRYLSRPAPSKNRPPKEVKPTQPVKSDDDVPQGMLSREQLDKLREAAAARQGRSKKATTPDTKKESSSPRQQQSRKAPARSPEPPIVVLARQVVLEGRIIAEKGAAARSISSTVHTLEQQGIMATRSHSVAKTVSSLRAQYKMAESFAQEAQDARLRMNEPFQKIMTLHAEWDDARKKREIASNERKKQEAYKTQVKDELLSLQELRQTVQATLKTYGYGSAVASLTSRRPNLKTKEAKELLDILTERYQRMEGMHRFLISRINTKRYRWGWGQGPSAKDILAANKDLLKITGKTMPWGDVPLANMVKLLKFYVRDKDLKRKQRAEQTLALAIFYYECGKDSAAEILTREVVSQYPTLKKDVGRLLPF